MQLLLPKTGLLSWSGRGTIGMCLQIPALPPPPRVATPKILPAVRKGEVELQSETLG